MYFGHQGSTPPAVITAELHQAIERVQQNDMNGATPVSYTHLDVYKRQVQYYGGYNAKLERQIRQALGSSEMRLFSVIGNHAVSYTHLDVYKRQGMDLSQGLEGSSVCRRHPYRLREGIHPCRGYQV